MNGKTAGKDAVLLFARYPFDGSVKTRLAAGIGAWNARGLYACFLKDAAAELKRLDAGIFVFFTPAAAGKKFSALLGADFPCVPQTGAALGERMANAFRAAFEAGAARAVLIGSDIPGLTAGGLRAAFAGLDRGAAVIGPALDGGYYLLGLRAEVFTEEIFKDISWSTPAVFWQTMERFGGIGIKPLVMEPLSDIDDMEGLVRFYSGKRGADTAVRTLRFIREKLAL